MSRTLAGLNKRYRQVAKRFGKTPESAANDNITARPISSDTTESVELECGSPGYMDTINMGESRFPQLPGTWAEGFPQDVDGGIPLIRLNMAARP
jgi:hypothetical protein